MRSTRYALSLFILLGASCLLFMDHAARASTAADSQQAEASGPVNPYSSACLTPLIQSAGGLCCPGTQSSVEPCVSSKPGVLAGAVKKLKPVVVNGVQIPLPVVMQMIKKGLGRPWSNAAADRGVMVCKYSRIPGTRLPLLRCNTNYVHFQGLIKTIAQGHAHIKPSDRKVHCYYNCFLTKENIINSLVRYVDNDIQTARVLTGLLEKAPVATATYSLRVPETVPMWFPKQHVIVGYPAYVTFVVGRGALADVQFARRKGPIRIEKRNVYSKQHRQRMNVGSHCADTIAQVQCSP